MKDQNQSPAERGQMLVHVGCSNARCAELHKDRMITVNEALRRADAKKDYYKEVV